MANEDYITTLLKPDATHLMTPNRGVGGASLGVGTPTVVADSGAYNGYAMSFSSSWISLPNVWMDAGTPGTSTDLTIDLHVKPVSLAKAYNNILTSLSAGGFSVAFTSDGYFALSSAWSYVMGTATTGKISVNTWTHIRICRASGTIYSFVNGALVLTVTASIAMTCPQYGLGGYDAGLNYSFTGLVDQVAFFDGIALSTANFTPPIQAWSILVQPPSVLTKPATVRGTTPNFPLNKNLLQMGLADYPIYFGGAGHITGTTTVKSSPSNLPVSRRVRLYEKVSGQMVAQTWSDANGKYSFSYLNTGLTFYVTTFDYTNTYEAVAADNLVPAI